MITVFTPTYNRKKLLERCYESLKKQSDKNFEWLVVDDGSADGTRKFVENIQKKASFKVRYLYQENGGKHRAWNLAVKKCKTEFMLILDSDDALTNDAIEILEAKCEIIGNDGGICGIIGNLGHMDGRGVIGVKIPDVKYTSGLELYQKMGFKGDTLRLYKTEVLRKYPFPEIAGENFVPENVIFDKIDQKYKMLVIAEVVYLGEYQEEGLTKNLNKVRLNNPTGNALALKSTAETALSFRKRLGVTILYAMWTRKFRIANAFRDFGRKPLYILCYPVSLIFQFLKFPNFYFRIFEEQK